MNPRVFKLGVGLVLAAASVGEAKTLLLVDDQDVLYRSGTHRVFHPLTRFEGNPVLEGGVKAWETAIAWCSVHRDPKTGLYQLWYQAYTDKAADKTRRCTVCYAESTDGHRFIRPNLGLFDFNGDRANSIVLVANGGPHDRYGASVVVDEHPRDPARRYKMAYYDFTQDHGRFYPGLSVAFSPDGVHWTKHPEGPLIRSFYGDFNEPVPYTDEKGRDWAVPMTMSDALDAIYDPGRGRYAIYGKMWIDSPDGGMGWKHGMGRTESPDFVHWSPPELLLTPDDRDPPWMEFHSAPVFYHESCYFSLLQILHRAEDDGVIDLELALSRDGTHWERPFRSPYALARDRKGAFDSGSIFSNASPVVLPDEIRFYYGAYSGGATSGDDYSFKSGVGLATLPLDRFAGLRPDSRSDQPTLSHPLSNIGQVTLRPLEFGASSELFLNADGSHGAVRVELLTERGYRIHGFAESDAVPVTSDGLRIPVRWRSKTLSDLPAGRYLVRLHLDNAEIFAVTLSSS